MKIWKIYVASAALVGSVGIADAHDWRSEGVSSAPALLEGDENAAPEYSARAILDSVKVWQTATPITLCFFNGSPELQAFFIKVTNQWVEAADGLIIDAKEVSGGFKQCLEKTADIRVSFASGGHWSYVGRDALKISERKPTLNVDVVDSVLSEQTKMLLKPTILHEMGHALAFEHEHQRPECEDELDWDKIYAELRDAPYFWSEDVVDLNIRSFKSEKIFGKYDPNSIMHYYLNSDWFFNVGEADCFIETANLELSAEDKKAAKRIYPGTPEAQVKHILEIKEKAAEMASGLNDDMQAKFIKRFNDNLGEDFSEAVGEITISVKDGVSIISTGDKNITAHTIQGTTININGD